MHKTKGTSQNNVDNMVMMITDGLRQQQQQQQPREKSKFQLLLLTHVLYK